MALPAANDSLDPNEDLQILFEALPEARFPESVEPLGEEPIKRGDLFHVMKKIGEFGVDPEEVREAVVEAEHAIQRVLNEQVEVALAPRKATVRKLQHRIIACYHLVIFPAKEAS